MKLDYAQPGKPADNALIESFNGRLRDEILNVNEFIPMQDAREKVKAWQHDCIHHHPHSTLGHLTPSEFVKMEVGSTTGNFPNSSLEVTGYGENVRFENKIRNRSPDWVNSNSIPCRMAYIGSQLVRARNDCQFA